MEHPWSKMIKNNMWLSSDQHQTYSNNHGTLNIVLKMTEVENTFMDLWCERHARARHMSGWSKTLPVLSYTQKRIGPRSSCPVFTASVCSKPSLHPNQVRHLIILIELCVWVCPKKRPTRWGLGDWTKTFTRGFSLDRWTPSNLILGKVNFFRSCHSMYTCGRVSCPNPLNKDMSTRCLFLLRLFWSRHHCGDFITISDDNDDEQRLWSNLIALRNHFSWILWNQKTICWESCWDP